MTEVTRLKRFLACIGITVVLAIAAGFLWGSIEATGVLVVGYFASRYATRPAPKPPQGEAAEG